MHAPAANASDVEDARLFDRGDEIAPVDIL
jgi:hypothetical protein